MQAFLRSHDGEAGHLTRCSGRPTDPRKDNRRQSEMGDKTPGRTWNRDPLNVFIAVKVRTPGNASKYSLSLCSATPAQQITTAAPSKIFILGS
ncbi:MAG: hypothetical protein JWM45_2734 [Pseudonocardiales bacterium]|nr:hypothetical protein [Pseudonocardiales bacterium]